jgi:predicted dienelactone hydrolase
MTSAQKTGASAAASRWSHLRQVVWGLALGLCSLGLAQAQVGTTEIAAGDMSVMIVYPSAQAASSVQRGPFELQVAVDAVPTPGKYRLVVLSHGTGGHPIPEYQLAATLARAGFVVAQPLHPGDNSRDVSRAGAESWKTRPSEVSRTIDALAQHPTWGPLLVLDKVGVHGSSAGGLTALALAGGQWRLFEGVRHCLENADADFGFCFSGALSKQEQDARREGLEKARGVPEDFMPGLFLSLYGGRNPADINGNPTDVRADTRIAAAVVSVPLVVPFTTESLARIAVPVGVVSAGKDQFLVPTFHSAMLLRECKQCTLLADLPSAGHMDLLAPWPEAIAREVATKHPRGANTEAGFDATQRQPTFDRIAAFFAKHLAQ